MTPSTLRRAEQAADPGEVLIGEPTLLVRDAVEVEPVEPLELKGKAQPVPAFRLLSRAKRPSGVTTRRFVGRKRELALAPRGLGVGAAERRSELVTVVGEAGVGKSRLVAEAARGRARRRPRPLPALRRRDHVLAGGRGAEAARRAPRPTRKPRRRFARSSVSARHRRQPTRSPGPSARRSSGCRGRPLVVVFDDIQWGKETFHDLIEHVPLSRPTSDSPALHGATGTRRTPAGWPVTSGSNPSTTRGRRLIGEQVVGDLRERITRAAGGNPLFVDRDAGDRRRCRR